MGETVSRRGFLSGAACVLAGAAAAKVSAQQGTRETQDIVTEEDVRQVEAQLAKPLSGEARKVLTETLEANRQGAISRLDFKLPENSEPCTIFVPRGDA